MVLTHPSESLSLLDVRTAESSRGFSLTTEGSAEGEVRISMSSSGGVVEGTRSILDIIFVVNVSADTGSEGETTFKEVALFDDLAGEIVVSDKLGREDRDRATYICRIGRR